MVRHGSLHHHLWHSNTATLSLSRQYWTPVREAMDDTEYDEEDLADLAQDTSISDLLLRNNEEDEGANSQIWDVDVGSLLDGLLGPSPPPPVEENKTQVDIEESDLVNSICKILLKYGKDGRIQGATLGQCLAKQNKVYLKELRSVTEHFKNYF